MHFDTYIHFCNHHHNQHTGYFHYPTKFPCALLYSSFPPLPNFPSTTITNPGPRDHCFNFYQISLVLSSGTSHKLNHLVLFFMSGFSPSIMFWRFIHIHTSSLISLVFFFFFLMLNSFPFYKYAMTSLPILLSKNKWIVFSLDL